MPRADGRPTAQEKRDAKIKAQQEKNGGATDVQLLNQKQIQGSGAASAPAAGELAKPQSAGAKVIVACKLGVPYFEIQLCRKVERFEQNMQGGRTVPGYDRIGNVVRLRGTAYPRGTPPVGFPAPPEIVDGAALNYGIDKDFFDAWLEQNHLNPVVMNKMVFAHESYDGVRGEAKDLGKFLSGLEPVNPKKDHRMPKSTRGDVSDIETEDGRAKKAAVA